MGDMIDRAKAKRAMETLHRTRSGYSGMGCNGYLTLTDATAQIIDAIPAVRVGVKPLEWRDSYGVLRAETPFGEYKVTGRILRLPSHAEQVHGTIEAAKAAAQADYGARIRSALTAQPSPKQLAAQPDDVAALVEAAKDALTVLEEYNMGSASPVICELIAALARVKGDTHE